MITLWACNNGEGDRVGCDPPECEPASEPVEGCGISDCEATGTTACGGEFFYCLEGCVVSGGRCPDLPDAGTDADPGQRERGTR